MEDSKTNRVLVNVVLDRSGSMGSTREGTISGYNEYLGGLKADKEHEYSVTLIQFDSPQDGPELTVNYVDRPLGDVPELDKKAFEPRGMTPLYDAVGECIRRVEAKNRAVLTVIITDGMENASAEFTKDAIKKLIQDKEAEGWKFVFLGANIDAAAVGTAIGITEDATAYYRKGRERALYQSLAQSTVRYADASSKYGRGSMEARIAAVPTMEERESMVGGSALAHQQQSGRFAVKYLPSEQVAGDNEVN